VSDLGPLPVYPSSWEEELGARVLSNPPAAGWQAARLSRANAPRRWRLSWDLLPDHLADALEDFWTSGLAGTRSFTLQPPSESALDAVFIGPAPQRVRPRSGFSTLSLQAQELPA